MGFDRREATLVVPNPAATVTQTMNLRGKYNRLLGFNILSTGTDTAMRLRMTDADSRIFYLDAADKDYDTARIYTPTFMDDVTTGLTTLLYDSTGAVVAATQDGPMPVVKNPIELAVVNGGTAGDSINVVLEYEYGCFGAQTFTLPTAASSTAYKTVSLGCKYAQILGFRALSVGTSTTQKMKIADADGRIVYLDATAQDYDTAALDKTLILDATVTGLTQVVPRANHGASGQAGVGIMQLPLVRSPITFTVLESEGNDEVVTATVYYKTG